MRQYSLIDDMLDPQNPKAPPGVLAQPGGAPGPSSGVIRTPDQRVRVFVSSTLDELGPERAAAQAAIRQLRLIPVLFELGAHPHPPRDLYRAYLVQSAIFVGIYWQRYGWVAPDMAISGLEDEYLLAQGKPKLIYLKAPAPTQEPRLQDLLNRIRDEEVACYRSFTTAEELQELLQDDLAILLTERFEQAQLGPQADASAREARDLPTGTVTFLYTEIAESTSLLQQLGSERYAALYEEHRRVARQAFAAHGGREVDASGDGFLIVFTRVSDAVSAAAQTQQALAGHPWPGEEAPRMRMGLHSGTAYVVDNQYVGIDVRRAALITAAGHGGQILLSDATRALVEHELPVGASLRDLGLHQLKDLQQPERLFQLTLPQSPTDFPPLKTLDAHLHNLPIQPTLLLGRVWEVKGLCALLCRDDVRLVTVTGPGGVGKTRLAMQVAAELMDAYADGVWAVWLSRLTDPTLVIPTIAHTLGLQETGNQPITAMLRAHLAEKRLLLVLDNFEQVVEAAGEVAGLLAATPGLKALVTSRVRLQLGGEREYPLASLPLPDPGHLLPPERLMQYAAVALFIERAQAARTDFTLTNETAPIVAEVCARLDGLPLAIELAAARVKLLPPLALLKRLERALPVLTGGPRDVDERQRTMRNTLKWSEDLLTPEEQRLFRRLAVFVGGCALEMAEAVCAAPEGAEPLGMSLFDGLSALVDRSLVQQREEDGEARFGLLHVVREYALERLEASGEGEALRRAHAGYFLALAERAEPELTGPEASAWLTRLEREHDNLRAALGWAHEQGEAEVGLRLAGALGRYWLAHGHLREGRAWVEGFLALGSEAVDTIQEGDDAAIHRETVRTLALLANGQLALWQGDDAAAQTQLEQAVALGRATGDLRAAAQALNLLGIAANYRGDLAQGRARFADSLALMREVGNLRGIAAALNNLGEVAFYQGDLAGAEAAYVESLALGRKVGDSEITAVCINNLGMVARRRGELAEAGARYREALTLARELKNPHLYAESLEGLASTAGTAEQGVRAARLLGAAVAVREALGAPCPAPEQLEIERAIAVARAALGEAVWAAAFAAGQALTLEAAIAEALGEDGANG